jgi:hypothetical protein
VATPVLAHYSFDQVSCIVGSKICDGFQEGEGVTVELSPIFEFVEGADGKVARSRTLRRSAKITIKLMATSETNDALSALANADRRNVGGPVPFTLNDRSGRTKLFSPQCWVEKEPDVTFGNQVGTREWELRCVQVEAFVGGN